MPCSRKRWRALPKKQMDVFGLGVVLLPAEGQRMLLGDDEAHVFCHGGRNKGFDAYFVATADTGAGAVVLINKDDDHGGIDEIVKAVAKKYAWP
jgi:hypothetical protein